MCLLKFVGKNTQIYGHPKKIEGTHSTLPNLEQN